jgi:hypothetical protein
LRDAPNIWWLEKHPAQNIVKAMKCKCEQTTDVVRQYSHCNTLPKRKEYHKFHCEELGSARGKMVSAMEREDKKGGHWSHWLFWLQLLRTKDIEHDKRIPAKVSEDGESQGISDMRCKVSPTWQQ